MSSSDNGYQSETDITKRPVTADTFGRREATRRRVALTETHLIIDGLFTRLRQIAAAQSCLPEIPCR